MMENIVIKCMLISSIWNTLCCRWLEHIFEAADKNGDGTLDLKEIIKLAKELNMGFTKRNIENMFEVCTMLPW